MSILIPFLKKERKNRRKEERKKEEGRKQKKEKSPASLKKLVKEMEIGGKS